MKNISDKMDALLMCGDKGASIRVKKESKAFLKIDGLPLFIHVLKALLGAGSVDRIFIVGNKKRLDRNLAKWVPGEGTSKPVVTLEQWGNLLTNLWNGFISSVDGYRPGLERTDQRIKNKLILAMAGDSPLISSEEIDEFISAADLKKYDYVAGLTPEESLVKYYPTEDGPGIRMSYFHVREGFYRGSNMHIARPFAIKNWEVIQRAYEARYQKKLRNAIRFMYNLMTMRATPGAILVVFRMHMALTFRRRGFPSLSEKLRRGISINTVMKAIGGILGLRAGYAITKRGGAALDVDNERDYITIRKMFGTWKKMQSASEDKGRA